MPFVCLPISIQYGSSSVNSRDCEHTVVTVQPSSGGNSSSNSTWEPPNTLSPTTHQVVTDCCRKLVCDCVKSQPVVGALCFAAGYLAHNAINNAFNGGYAGRDGNSGQNSSGSTTTSTTTPPPWYGSGQEPKIRIRHVNQWS